jgi:hypothetical protein
MKTGLERSYLHEFVSLSEGVHSATGTPNSPDYQRNQHTQDLKHHSNITATVYHSETLHNNNRRTAWPTRIRPLRLGAGMMMLVRCSELNLKNLNPNQHIQQRYKISYTGNLGNAAANV